MSDEIEVSYFRKFAWVELEIDRIIRAARRLDVSGSDTRPLAATLEKAKYQARDLADDHRGAEEARRQKRKYLSQRGRVMTDIPFKPTLAWAYSFGDRGNFAAYSCEQFTSTTDTFLGPAYLVPAEQWEAQGWQPIETAPKDGTEILGCVAHPRLYAPTRIVWAAYHPNSKGKETWRNAPICGDKMERVTHWMPLPAPPTQEPTDETI